MTAWAVVVMALAWSSLIAAAVGRRLARVASALPVPDAVVAFGDPDETAAMDRERERLEVNAEAATLLAELRRLDQ